MSPQGSCCTRRVHYFEYNNIKIAVKIDLACWRPDGTLIIADWKTGNTKFDWEGRYQLAVYVLWAIMTFKIGIDRIFPMIVSLSNGDVTEFKLIEEDINLITEKIKTDLETTNYYYKNNKNFPTDPEIIKCWGCLYLHRCIDGKKIISII